jgi:RNA polymerase sigma-70 factor (ECF subfamily)
MFSLSDEFADYAGGAKSGNQLQHDVAQMFVDSRDDVYRYLLSLGLHPPQAQEGAQEVFLRLYATLRKGEEIQNPRAWIFRVAHNLGLKVRARENSQAPFDAELELSLAEPGLDPEQGLIERERLQRLHSGIQQLSEQQRRCLFLRMEGLRHPEIGTALGISTSAVGEFLRRALVRLRKADA